MPTTPAALAALTPVAAVGWFVALNAVILMLSLLAGEALRRLFAHRPVSLQQQPLTARELALTAVTVLLNGVVTLCGWQLWQQGVIRISAAPLWRSALDCLILLVIMDAAMYLLHRAAHHPLIYPLLHAPHHRYRQVRPLTLFVLHPAEVLGFGGLWLAVLVAYPASWLGLSAYLALNVVFGTVGHCGVEPLPPAWARVPVLGLVTGGAFHAAHHRDETGNFGFYSEAWDRLFGSLVDLPQRPIPPS